MFVIIIKVFCIFKIYVLNWDNEKYLVNIINLIFFYIIFTNYFVFDWSDFFNLEGDEVDGLEDIIVIFFKLEVDIIVY